MKIRWLGQASFSIGTAGGTVIRMDPFDESLGLPISDEPADVITVSHGHGDHNAAHLVPGDPAVVALAHDRHQKSLALRPPVSGRLP